jgi:methylated-DNA-[protein]-cysteine S-methyltransferase
MTPTLTTAHLDTPLGRLVLVARRDALVRICFPDDATAPPCTEPADRSATPVLRRTASQLAEYFAGARDDFDLPLAPAGTAFQQRVWSALRRVRYGTTTTYGSLAHVLGLPRAARAVGAANGANPLPVVVPCHRVIGSDGSLTGYAGGLRLKRWLLEREREGVAQ